MIPHERSLVKQLKGKPFALIGVNSDDEIDVARNAVEKLEINWRSFWNGEKGTFGPISTKWNVDSWPKTYLIDAKGIIRYKDLKGEKLDEAIKKLMAEAGHEVELEAEKKEAETKEAAEKKTATVTGKVTLDGAPVASGKVRLISNNGNSGSGEIGSDGSFTIEESEKGEE